MKDKWYSKRFAYTVISFACPFIAFITIYVYQSIAHGDFWASLNLEDDADRAAGVIMGFSEIVQMIIV